MADDTSAYRVERELANLMDSAYTKATVLYASAVMKKFQWFLKKYENGALTLITLHRRM